MWNLIAGSFTNSVLFRSFVIRYCTMKLATPIENFADTRQRKWTFSDMTLDEARQLHTFDEYFKREAAETVFEKAGKKITPKLLLEAIRTLPEEKRKAILLYYFEGMNDTEIAELFNTSRSTIQYRRTSSFEKLRKYLEENADEWDEW